MLHRILDAAGLDVASCAAQLGVSSVIFAEWAAGQRRIPDSYVPLLATVVGVPASLLRLSPKQVRSTSGDITPAIWYKFRGAQVVDADRECVLLIRQLGFNMHELEEATGRRSAAWKSVFEGVRRSTDLQAPPREQGRQAARVFRQSTGLDQGASGIGEVFRGHLRNLGLIVVESPLEGSMMEGCSFFVGSESADRPCLFANSYRSTWFRRNMVLMHELAHAIFDAESAGASLDFLGANEQHDLSEARAESFAQEALAPREVIRHASQRHGIGWSGVSAQALATLVAEIHVEQGVVLAAAVDAGLLGPDDAIAWNHCKIGDLLPGLTDRALSTAEYIQKKGGSAEEWIAKRTTTVPRRGIRLPSRFVESVVAAVRDGAISRGKAARFLMIDEGDFAERFGSLEQDCLE